MATELTVIKPGRNAESTGVVGVNADSSTGVYVDCNQIDASKLVFRLVSSDSGAILIKDGGLYSAEGIGDLQVISTEADTVFVTVETARFKDTDGYINLLGQNTETTKGSYAVQAILLP